MLFSVAKVFRDEIGQKQFIEWKSYHFRISLGEVARKFSYFASNAGFSVHACNRANSMIFGA